MNICYNLKLKILLENFKYCLNLNRETNKNNLVKDFIEIWF